jgi:hypothetical protein
VSEIVEPWSEEDVQRLYEGVRKELRDLFGHERERSETLFSEWLVKFPHWTPDLISHEGPFNMAQRIQYGLVLCQDPNGSDFLEWRKQFHKVWEARRHPKLTEWEKLVLRSRGVDV